MRSRLLQHRGFGLLLAAESLWHLGNQFYLIALPWLVLRSDGDGLVLGKVLLLSGIPRVVLMPVGGALSDRVSARTLLLLANAGRALLLGALAGLVLAGPVEPWMLYSFSLGYGGLEALLYPARSAMGPALVPPAHLRQANAVLGGVERTCALGGPALAGVLIAGLDGRAPAGSASFAARAGLGVALGLVATLTLAAAALFGCLPARRPLPRRDRQAPAPGLLSSIGQGLRYLWQHGTLRALFLVVSAINLFTIGPLYVGLPLLAGTRLTGGAAALGVLTSALGDGALLGTALAGVLPQPAPRRLGLGLLLALGLCAGGLAALCGTSSILAGALLVLGIGAAVNYANVTLVTWVQRHTPPAMMGRLMSLVALK